jgi:hypothetical protein
MKFSWQSPSNAQNKPFNHPLSMNQPLNLGELKLQLTDYKCSGQYDREVADRLIDAQTYVDMRSGQVNHPFAFELA